MARDSGSWRFSDVVILALVAAFLIVGYVTPWFGWDPIWAAFDEVFRRFPRVTIFVVIVLAVISIGWSLIKYRRTGDMAEFVRLAIYAMAFLISIGFVIAIFLIDKFVVR